MTKAIFPGSFDPLTKGHLDLIKRASKMFDEVVVTVAKNTSKNGVFSYDERMSLIKPNIEGIKNVSVTSADGLTVDLAEQVGATVIVRGLRNSSDFNAESSIASMNYNLDNTIESVFLITRPEFQSVSSSLIKEIAHFGGDITPYVPQNVATALKEEVKLMFKNNRRNKLITLFVAIAALAILVNIPFLPKYIESPGTSPNLKPVVSIKGHSDKFKGKFMFTTVSESQASIASYVVAKFNPHQTIESISDVTGNQDQQSYINLQNVYMESAINNAIYNAFHYAKKDVYLKYRGIYVLAVDSKSNFYNQIKAGDSIVSLNGHRFKSSAQFRNYVKSKKIGSKMTLTVYRNKKKIKITRKLYKLAGTNQAGIGIILSDDNQVSTKIPIDVNPGEVGGPSAGLMFSLQIYGQLTQQNIRHSQNIAGTGTIDENGNVGEIGGIDKKIIAARDAGAKYFLAPYVKPTKEVLKYEDQHMTNYQLAVKTAKKYAPNMKVIPVTSFSDALNALKKIK